MLDGLMLGAGDAVIGINPVGDSVPAIVRLLHLLDESGGVLQPLGLHDGAAGAVGTV